MNIPKHVTLGVDREAKTGTADYTVSVRGEIEPSHSITVEPDSSFAMSSGSRQLTATVTQDVTSFGGETLTLDTPSTTDGNIAVSGLKGGTYSGSFNFHIAEKAGAGHVHNYVDGKCTECGEADPNHVHSYTESITKQPTCTDTGVKTFTCACGDSHTETMPVTSHNYVDGVCEECGAEDPDAVKVTDGLFDAEGNSLASWDSLVNDYGFDISSDSGQALKTVLNTYSELSGATKLVVGDGVTKIGNGALQSCLSITEVVLPEGLQSIGNEAFEVTRIESIDIPASVTSIGSNALHFTTSLTDINVAADNPNYTSVDGVLYNKNKSVLYKMPEKNSIVNYNMPSSVTTIKSEAFRYCSNLRTVKLSSNLSNIENCAFGNSTLENVNFSGTKVTSVPVNCFADCTSLKWADLSGVSSLGSVAFLRCSNLEAVFVGSTITTVPSPIAFSGAFQACDASKLAVYTDLTPSTASSRLGDWWYAVDSGSTKARLCANSSHSLFTTLVGNL